MIHIQPDTTRTIASYNQGEKIVGVIRSYFEKEVF
jgi:hypothetical protein